ncbi:MAG: hypothetical protein TREMPRED_006015, partial [Tremellales sp. Tagirdzhanova-0007]
FKPARNYPKHSTGLATGKSGAATSPPFTVTIEFDLRIEETKPSIAMPSIKEDSEETPAAAKLTMQIILPRDLNLKDGWPIGSMMVQAAHAATAVLHLHADHRDVQSYLKNWGQMRKAIFEITNQSLLLELASRLDKLTPKIPYHLWIEQPEGIATALALVPNTRPKELRKLLEEAGCGLWK